MLKSVLFLNVLAQPGCCDFMSEHGGRENGDVLRGMAQALESWVDRGQVEEPRALARPRGRERGRSDPSEYSRMGGLPRALVEAGRQRPDWPESLEDRTRSLLRSVLRFSRTDGTLTTQFNGEVGRGTLENLAALAKAFPRTGEARVLGWWLSLTKTTHVPPPLPAWSSERHPLAVLRASWQKQDDMVVVDHRERGSVTRLEVIGSGHSWLGPEWTSLPRRDRPRRRNRGTGSRTRPPTWRNGPSVSAG